MKNSLGRIRYYVGPIFIGVLLLFGLYLTIIQINELNRKNTQINSSPIQTKAVVVGKKYVDRLTQVTYSYKVNGVSYKSRYDIEGDVKIGDSITISYHSKNPEISNIRED